MLNPGLKAALLQQGSAMTLPASAAFYRRPPAQTLSSPWREEEAARREKQAVAARKAAARRRAAAYKARHKGSKKPTSHYAESDPAMVAARDVRVLAMTLGRGVPSAGR